MISLQDIVYAAALALIITWVIRSASRVLGVLAAASSELGYHPAELDTIMKKCYRQFPIDNMDFNGATFRRGMNVRVVINRNKTIEGKFVGANRENMACFVTPQFVVAHQINSIEDISVL